MSNEQNDIILKNQQELKKEKKHICDGGDDYGLVGCFQCEKEMLQCFNKNKK